MKKGHSSQLLIFILVFVAIVTVLILQLNHREQKIPNVKPVEVKKAEIDSKLPYTLQVVEGDEKPETIAYRFWFELMDRLLQEGAIAGKTFTRFTKLAGDENSFIVAAVFQVQLPEAPKIDYGLGKADENRVVPDIVWKLSINKGEGLTYTLTNIERTTDTKIGLPPVESMEDYQKKAGIKDQSKGIDYEMKDDTLRVTYDGGENWKVVPVAVGDLVRGDSNDPQEQLMDGSYVMTPEITAFLLNGVRVLTSRDKGETWNEVLVSNQLPALRLQKLGFTSGQDGYLILTGEKTMSWEAHFVFKTNDGGRSWHNAGSVKDVYSLVTDGGFINGQLGFISFGEIRYEGQPPKPNLYRTADGGANWEPVEVPIPEEYLGYFTVAEIPVFNGTEGTLLVNQGPNGDYLGGNVLAKFVSRDQGKTWSFVGLVDPDGVLR
ncbi:exo-alpha-sialidase [Neobacillus notoginsengisoli]|uniref:Exo-alpha-sialidase n=1 Tax=Neobacillus notoginsengisoli TaxID=1578198 RepID=A0A417Z0B2_9BACI|nr:sialidase family protein [Neobacillus notoginsengisoli]RHW43515.1 exo-alpha-sialidase [Neobacillus notoginsengisoli]